MKKYVANLEFLKEYGGEIEKYISLIVIINIMEKWVAK